MRILIGLWIALSHLPAQTALTGGLVGSILDEQGRPVAATLLLSSPTLDNKQQAVAGPNGEYRFLGLAPSVDYSITITVPGYATVTRPVSILSGESTVLPVILRPGSDSVTVLADSDTLGPEATETGTSVRQGQIANLPSNGRLLNRFALLDAHVRNTSGLGGDGFASTRLGINGQIFRETQYRLDGNTNYDTLFNNAPLQRISMSSVQEFRVLTNQFNAEHGSTSTGLIITTTRSGTDTFHGEGFFYGRPSGIQSRPPLATRRIPNQLLQEGGAIGGPLARSRAYFFGNFERLAQDRGSFINSPRPDLFVGQYRDSLALAKLDYRFSERHWLSARFNGQRESNTNGNDRVGGLMQVNTANKTLGQSVGSQMTDTSIWGRMVNEVRAGYTNAVPSNTIPLNPQTSVNRAGYSNEGSINFTMVRTEVYQIADQLSWQKGTHNLKVGGDFIRRKVRDFTYDLFGAYTFAAGAPTPGQQPLQYSQRFGTSRISYGQTQWSGFIQDSWRLRPRLTLNYGLRYDYQSILDDKNNLGPRFGIAWDTKGDGATIIRLGGGLYYDQPFFHGLTQRFIQNGLTSPFATITIPFGSAGFPQFPASFPSDSPPAGFAFAPRNINLRGNRLLSPYTSQITAGFDRKLPGGWTLSATAIRSLSVKMFIHFDRNAANPFPRTAPGQVRSVAAADRTRPFFDPAAGVSLAQSVAVRELRQTENGGIGNYHALDVRLARAFAKRYQVGMHYVWASAVNTVTNDHLGSNPNEWSDVVRGERGPSEYLQRQRMVANGSVTLMWGLQASAYAVLASGQAVNPLTGVDNNGDANLFDRPAGFGRNAFRGREHRSFDFSLAKPVKLSEGVLLQIRGDIFNAFNNQNFYAFNAVYGDTGVARATFLQPIGGVANADPGRQFTFGAKLVF